MTNTPEFYESEYSARSRVPDYQRYFDRWAEESARARQQLVGHLDLPYRVGVGVQQGVPLPESAESEQETLDLFPASGSKRLLVFIHGGYWRSMDKRDFSWVARPFVEAGISVAVPNYALCPTVTVAAIVDQNRQALAWLYHHAKDYGADFEQIIVAGHSAGGHLTAMMFATDWSAYGVPDDAFAGGIALSGLFDLEPFPVLQMNADLQLDAESAKAVSPVNYQPCISVPLVVAVGALESGEFHRQSESICDVWREICVGPLDLEDYHHFNILEPFTDLNSTLWQSAHQLLSR